MGLYDGHEGSATLDPNYVVAGTGYSVTIDTTGKVVGNNCVNFYISGGWSRHAAAYRTDVVVQPPVNLVFYYVATGTAWAPAFIFGGPDGTHNFFVNCGGDLLKSWVEGGYYSGDWAAKTKLYSDQTANAITLREFGDTGAVIRIEINWKTNGDITAYYKNHATGELLYQFTFNSTLYSGGGFGYKLATAGGLSTGGSSTRGYFDGGPLGATPIDNSVTSFELTSDIDTVVPILSTTLGSPILTAGIAGSSIHLDW